MVRNFICVVAYGTDNSSIDTTEASPQTTLLHLSGDDTVNISSGASSSTGSNSAEVLEFAHSSANLSKPRLKTGGGDMPFTTHKTPLQSASQIVMFNSSHDENSTADNNSLRAYPTETFTVKIVYLAQLCMDSPERLSKESLASEVLRIRAAEYELSKMESAVNNNSQTESRNL